MAYQSLYRKYRPQRFGELVGQEHVTAALRNAVRDGRVGHAYLFSGPRGTGKTTTARILAKALNCTDLGADGEPCGECDHCRAIAAGTFLDLFELDAASNRGVSDARDLLERIAFRSAAGGKKVYILDEVHMLTDAAANTLLKSLEEPPDHVVFVLATTNPESVLPTIRSRTQHFEFTLLSTEQLAAHLADVCAREGVDADPEALDTIARAGAGSARDALSLLDQALAHGTARLEADAVAALFGGTPFVRRAEILEAVVAEDPAGALVSLGELLDAGHEPRRVADDLLRATRDAFLLVAAAGRVPIDAPVDEADRLRAIGEALGSAGLVRAIETLGQAVVDMRGADAADPRLVLEVALVRLARRDAGPPLAVLAERVDRLERALAGDASGATPVASLPTRPAEPVPAASGAAGAAGAAAEPRSGPARALGALRDRTRDASAPPPRAESSPSPPSAAPKPTPTPAHHPGVASPIELDDVIVAWAAVLPDLPVATRTAVQAAQPVRVESDVVVFGVPPSLLEAAKPRFRREADTIRDALSARLGRTMKFSLVASDDFAVVSGAAPRPAPARHDAGSAAAPAPEAEAGEPDDVVDLADTVDADPGAPAVSSVSLLEQSLGATVVEEVPRD